MQPSQDAGIRVAVVGEPDAELSDQAAPRPNARCAGIVGACARLGARVDLILLAPATSGRTWTAPPGAAPTPVLASVTLPVTGERVQVAVVPEQDADHGLLAGSDAVIAAPRGRSAGSARALRAGRSAGALTVLNPDLRSSDLVNLLPDADVLVVNLRETAGTRCDPAAVEAMGAAMLRHGPELAAISAGPAGTYFAWPDGRLWWPAPAAADRATSGVTEALTAGLAMGLAEGQATADATRFAAAVAALATRLPGPPRVLPSRRQVRLLLAQPWPAALAPTPVPSGISEVA